MDILILEQILKIYTIFSHVHPQYLILDFSYSKVKRNKNQKNIK